MLALLLFSSCSANRSSWNYASIPSAPCQRLCLAPKNSFKNLEIALQKENEGTRAIINVYAIPLKPESDGKTKVTLTLDGTSTSYTATVLEGGQRIVLPSDAEQKLINALFQKKPLVLATGRYSTEVNYEGFEEPFSHFQNNIP